MKKNNFIWILVVIVLIILIVWYFMPMKIAQPQINPSTNMGLNNSLGQTNTGQVKVSPVVQVSLSSTLGKYLVGSNGMTLYMYAKDTQNVSNCVGGCSLNWPPYSPAINEPLIPGDGITGKLSAITRADGSTQLTYKGIPLYFWINDKKVGDTTGQGIADAWSVVKP